MEAKAKAKQEQEQVKLIQAPIQIVDAQIAAI
jgi:hypothetical protein